MFRFSLNKKIYLLLFLLLLTVVIRIPFITMPLNRDEGGYAYIGYNWLRSNLLPYRDAFEHKTPMAHIIYGLATFIMPNNLLLSIRFTSLGFMVLFVAVFYFFVLEVATLPIAFLSSVLFVFLSTSSAIEGVIFNTETIIGFLVLLSMYLFYKQFINTDNEKYRYLYIFINGLLLGIGTLTKQIVVLNAFGIFCLILFIQRRKLISKQTIFSFLLFSLGFLLPILSVCLYFLSQNAFDIFIKDTLLYNFHYIHEGLKSTNIDGRTGITNTILSYPRWLLMLPTLYLFLAPFSLVGMVFLWKHKKKQYFFLLLVSYLLLLAGVKLGGSREADHYYFTLLAPLCLGIASFLYYAKIPLRSIGYLFLIIFSFFSWNGDRLLGSYGIQQKLYGTQADEFYQAVDLGKYLQHTPKNKSIFVLANEPEIYFYAKKRAYDRNMNLYDFYFFPEDQDIWWKNINKTPPSLLVTYNNHDEPMHSLLEKYLQTHHEFKQIPTTLPAYNLYVK